MNTKVDDTTTTPASPTTDLAPTAQTGETVKPMFDANAKPGGDNGPMNSPKEDSSESDFNFADFENDYEVEAPAVSTPAAPSKVAEAEPKAPVEAAKPAEPAVPVEPTTPTAPTTTTVTPETPPAAPVVPETPQLTPEQQQEQYQQWFSQTAEALEKQVYVFDDATKEQLDTKPSEIIPKLAAQQHAQILVAATTQAAQLFTAMFPALMTRYAEDQANEAKFYQQFPKLVEHKQTVDKLASLYYASKPSVTIEQAINEIGTWAHMQLRIPIDAPQPTPVVQVPPATVPLSAGGPGKPAAPQSGDANSWVEDIFGE